MTNLMWIREIQPTIDFFVNIACDQLHLAMRA